jgi:nitrate/nitrite-specific signal transduction histidine kinase
LIALLLIAALIDMRRNLVKPLRQLMQLSHEFGQHRFESRSHFRHPNELGKLGRTLSYGDFWCMEAG